MDFYKGNTRYATMCCCTMEFGHKGAFALSLFGSGSLLGDGVGNCKLVSMSEPFS